MQPVPAQSSIEPGTTMDERRAVVIEDDVDLGNLLGMLLEGKGYIVRIAGNGPDGIQAVRDLNPTLITTDLGLPGMDGVEVIWALRAFSNAPILVVSASIDAQEVDHALAAGGDGYLPKPFSPDTFRAHISELEGRKENT